MIRDFTVSQYTTVDNVNCLTHMTYNLRISAKNEILNIGGISTPYQKPP